MFLLVLMFQLGQSNMLAQHNTVFYLTASAAVHIVSVDTEK